MTFKPAHALLFVCLACAEHSADHAQPPRLVASSDPDVVGSIDEQVSALTVVGDHLFWAGVYAPTKGTQDGTGTALHGCIKDRCSETLVTYAAADVDSSWGIGVHDQDVYWNSLTDRALGGTTVVTCPIAGCAGQPRSVLGSYLSLSEPHPVFAADGMYFVDESNALRKIGYGTMPVSAELPTLTLRPIALGVNDEYVYWIDGEQLDYTLRRVRSDGSGTIEVLAERLRIARVLTPQNPSAYLSAALSFDERYVYWTDNTPAGGLMRCPLAGGKDATEVLAEPIRSPARPVIDGATLYYQYDDTLLGKSLARCTVDHCEPSAPLVTGLNGWSAVALDDRYVYAATTDQRPNADLPWLTPSAVIRRVSK